jgi:hypothetical protein
VRVAGWCGVHRKRSQSPCGYVASCQHSSDALGSPLARQRLLETLPLHQGLPTRVKCGGSWHPASPCLTLTPVPQPDTFQSPQVTTLAIQSTMVRVIRRSSPHSSTQHTRRGLADVELRERGGEADLLAGPSSQRPSDHSTGKPPRASALSPSFSSTPHKNR